MRDGVRLGLGLARVRTLGTREDLQLLDNGATRGGLRVNHTLHRMFDQGNSGRSARTCSTVRLSCCRHNRNTLT